MKGFILFIITVFYSLNVVSETPHSDSFSRNVVVIEDTIQNTYRLFNTGIDFKNDSLERSYYFDFVSKNGEKSQLDLSRVFDFSFYLKTSQKTSFTIQLITNFNGVVRTSKPIEYTVYKDNGSYKQTVFNLPITENTNDLKNVIGMKVTFAPNKASSLLLDEIVLSYFQEEKIDPGKEAFTKNKAKEEFEKYLDKKREEGFDHQRKIEASKNNR